MEGDYTEADKDKAQKCEEQLNGNVTSERVAEANRTSEYKEDESAE